MRNQGTQQLDYTDLLFRYVIKILVYCLFCWWYLICTLSRHTLNICLSGMLWCKGEINARWWRFLVTTLFRLVEIVPKLTKTSGSLRQNIFDKLYCILLNNLIQKQVFVMRCNHTSRQRTSF